VLTETCFTRYTDFTAERTRRRRCWQNRRPGDIMRLSHLGEARRRVDSMAIRAYVLNKSMNTTLTTPIYVRKMGHGSRVRRPGAKRVNAQSLVGEYVKRI
jgi:hypothetical protein